MADYTGRGSGPDAPEDGPYRLSKKLIGTVLGTAAAATLAIGLLIYPIACPRKPKPAPETTPNEAVCRAPDDFNRFKYDVSGKRIIIHGFDDRNNPCVYEMSRDNFCSMYDLCKSKPTPIKRKLVAPKPKPHPAQPVKTAPVPPAAPHAEAPKPQGTPPAPQVSRYPVEVHELKPMPLDKFERGDFVLERCK